MTRLKLSLQIKAVILATLFAIASTASSVALADNTSLSAVAAETTASISANTFSQSDVAQSVKPPQVVATVTTVRAGDNLQQAVDNASPGDTLVLEAGAVFPGTIYLRNKNTTSTAYITIQSSRAAELPAGKRVTPADVAKMATITTLGNGSAAIETELQAHHYKLIGIEVRPATNTAFAYELIRFGTAEATQSTFDSQAHHLILDRSYVHPFANQELKRGLALNSRDTDITNSWFDQFKVRGQDSQAIAGWNGSGNYRIINNRLEAASYPFILGGAYAYIPNMVPTNIEFRHNYCTRPAAWRGQGYMVKNLFELKNARSVLVDGNVFENNWADAQAGVAILFTIRSENGTMPQAIVEDVTFSNNIVRNSEGGVNILGLDDSGPSQTAKRIAIKNNLFTNINGLFVKITDGEDISFEHNTITQTGNIVSFYGNPTRRLIFKDNIAEHNDYGFIGDSHGVGLDSINFYAPASVITGNVIIGGSASRLPVNNYFPATDAEVGFRSLATMNYRLSASSAYLNRGSNGADIGVDFVAWKLALATRQ